MGNQLPFPPLKTLQRVLVALGEERSAFEGQHNKATDMESSAAPTLICEALPVPSCVSPRRCFFPLRFRLLPVRPH